MEKAIPNTNGQIFRKNSGPLLNDSERGGNKLYSENHDYFLNIIAMICKNKYFAFGIIQTMV